MWFDHKNGKNILPTLTKVYITHIYISFHKIILNLIKKTFENNLFIINSRYKLWIRRSHHFFFVNAIFFYRHHKLLVCLKVLLFCFLSNTRSRYEEESYKRCSGFYELWLVMFKRIVKMIWSCRMLYGVWSLIKIHLIFEVFACTSWVTYIPLNRVPEPRVFGKRFTLLRSESRYFFQFFFIRKFLTDSQIIYAKALQPNPTDVLLPSTKRKSYLNSVRPEQSSEMN